MIYPPPGGPPLLWGVRIFLVSPGGLDIERKIVRTVVDELNHEEALKTQVFLHVTGWEDVPSGIGRSGQDVIFAHIADEYEILLGLMADHLGSPVRRTRRTPSGTVAEYRRALARHRANQLSVDIMFYFRAMHGIPSEVDEFRTRVDRDGVYYHRFTNRSRLRHRIKSDLKAKMEDWPRRMQMLTESTKQ
jgi:hypothetical protein